VQLLSNLRTALQSEVIELTFDWLAFHRTCRTLLLNITRELKPELEVAGAKGMYHECEVRLPITVGYIFVTATDATHLPGMDRAKTWPKWSLHALTKASQVVKEEIKEHGDVQVRRLREAWRLEVDF
jgi:hypothetical protein